MIEMEPMVRLGHRGPFLEPAIQLPKDLLPLRALHRLRGGFRDGLRGLDELLQPGERLLRIST